LKNDFLTPTQQAPAKNNIYIAPAEPFAILFIQLVRVSVSRFFYRQKKAAG